MFAYSHLTSYSPAEPMFSSHLMFSNRAIISSHFRMFSSHLMFSNRAIISSHVRMFSSHLIFSSRANVLISSHVLQQSHPSSHLSFACSHLISCSPTEPSSHLMFACSHLTSYSPAESMFSSHLL